MVYCPRCETENPDGAAFCRSCGCDLRQLASQVVAPGPRRARGERGRKAIAIAGGVLAGLLVLLAVAVVVRRPAVLKPIEGQVRVVPGEGIELHVDHTQFDEGGEGLAEVSVSVPEGYEGSEVVVGGNTFPGTGIVSFSVSDMTPAGDGTLVYTFPIDVPTSVAGMRKIWVHSPDPDGDAGMDVIDPDAEDAGQGDQDQQADEQRREDSARLYVSPVIGYEDVLACAEVAQGALEWAEANGAGAEELASWLMDNDVRVGQAWAYGSEVYFTTQMGVLGSVQLDPIDPTYLGAGFETNTAATEALERWETGDAAAAQRLARSDDLCSNPDVLVLEPTPELFAADVMETYAAQAQAIAGVTEGEARVASGPDALLALMSGDLARAGTILLHAHGSQVEASGTVNLLFGVGVSAAGAGWDDARSGLEACLAAVQEGLSAAASNPLGKDVPWQLFAGDAAYPSSWRMCVTVAAVRGSGAHVEGVRVSTDMISWWYQDLLLDDCLIYMGSCYGLADVRFDQWALSHGAQVLVGYTGRVQAQADAESLMRMVEGLTGVERGGWRTRTVGEVSRMRLGMGSWLGWELGNLSARGEADPPGFMGNGGFYYAGATSVRGRVASDAADDATGAFEGLTVRAYVLRGFEFVLADEVVVDERGAFAFEGLPAGVCVFEVCRGGEVVPVAGGSTFSLAPDAAQVDGGTVTVTPAAAEGGGAPESSGEPAAIGSELGVMNSSYVVHDGRLYFIWNQVYHPTGDEEAAPSIVSCNLDGSDLRTEAEGDSRLYYRMLIDAGDRLIATAGNVHKAMLASIYSFDYASSESTLLMNFHALSSRPHAQDGTVYFLGYGDDDLYLTINGHELNIADVHGGSEVSVLDLSPFGFACEGVGEVVAVVDGYIYLNCYGDYWDDTNQKCEVYAVPLDSGTVTKLFDAPSGARVAGNRIIVFDASGTLWSYALDGSDGRQLASFEANEYWGPSIKNANSQYVYVSPDGSGVYLERIDLSTGEQLTMSAEDGMWGAFDIIGDKIYYFWGYDEIMRCDLDGGNREVVFSAR